MKKLCIIMMSYNHEKYIEQSLQGILKQKVDFEYEVILGDDCSTDKTQEIIKKYIPIFGERMVPVLRNKNIGAMRNLYDLLLRANGEYLAFLEGDDYWIDENKLQEQVDFLDKHRDFAGFYHKNKLVDGKDNVLMEYMPDFWEEELFTKSELEHFCMPGQTATAVVRSEYIKKYLSRINEVRILFTPGDRILPILLLANGKIYCSNKIMSAYRTIIYDDDNNSSSWSKKFGRDNFFGNWFFFNMHREIENIGKLVGLDLNLKQPDWDMTNKVCKKIVYEKRIWYIILYIYVLCRSRHRGYILKNSLKKLLRK